MVCIKIDLLHTATQLLACAIGTAVAVTASTPGRHPKSTLHTIHHTYLSYRCHTDLPVTVTDTDTDTDTGTDAHADAAPALRAAALGLDSVNLRQQQAGGALNTQQQQQQIPQQQQQ